MDLNQALEQFDTVDANLQRPAKAQVIASTASKYSLPAMTSDPKIHALVGVVDGLAALWGAV